MLVNPNSNQVKLIDFGLAKKYNPKETIQVLCGTPEFIGMSFVATLLLFLFIRDVRKIVQQKIVFASYVGLKVNLILGHLNLVEEESLKIKRQSVYLSHGPIYCGEPVKATFF